MKLLALLAISTITALGCQSTTTPVADVVPRTAYAPIPIGEYKLISVEDVSYARVRRYVARIRVGYENSPANVEAILKRVALDVQRDKRANAVSVCAVGPDESPDFGYTAGMVDYAPDGNWGNADQALPMSYSVTLGDEFFEELDRQRTFAPGTTHTLISRDGTPIDLYEQSNPMDRVIGRVKHGTEVTILDETKHGASGDYLIRYRVKSTASSGRPIAGWVSSHSVNKE